VPVNPGKAFANLAGVAKVGEHEFLDFLLVVAGIVCREDEIVDMRA